MSIPLALSADPPSIMSYQGKVAVGGTNFNGAGQFKFALVDGTGATTYWSNDGTSTSGSQPSAAVSLNVLNGLYSLGLGDTSLTNMQSIPASVFMNPDVRERVWFNDGTHGFQLLTPDKRVTSVGYAMNAAGLQLPLTVSPNSGVIMQGGSRFIHSYGDSNFFAGTEAGNLGLTGYSNTAIGSLSMSLNSTGYDNAAAGAHTLLVNSTGFSNSAFGANALYGNTSGSENTGTGAYSLYSNTFGYSNTASGSGAMYSNSTGYYNVAVGASALHDNTTGYGNTAIGVLGLNSNLTGTNNTAIGFSSLSSNTTGTDNIAVGINAGVYLTTGNHNIDIGHVGVAGESNTIRIGTPGTQTDIYLAGVIHGDGSGLANLPANQSITNITVSGQVNLPSTSGPSSGLINQNGVPLIHTYGSNDFFAGSNAGNFVTTGYLNTGVGVAAIHSISTGFWNTAEGAFALTSNSSGYGNTATGYESLYSNIAGNENTAIGLDALFSNTNGYSNTSSGAKALYLNTLGYANAASGASALYANTSGFGNTAIGYQSLSGNTSGNTNTACGMNALVANSTGNNNIGIGLSAGANLTTGSGNIDIGNQGVAGESNIIRIGTSQTDTFLTGVIHAATYSGLSDARYKTNVRPITSALDTVCQLRGVSYNWRQDEFPNNSFDNTRHAGFIAQELREILPDAVKADGQGFLSVAYTEVIPLLVEALKEGRASLQANQAENKALKLRISELETRDKDREARLQKLEQLLLRTSLPASASPAQTIPSPQP